MGEKVLFVDDDPRLLDGVRRRLRKRYDVHTAVGPERGLAALQSKGPFAVVVADMSMPGIDGAEFLRQARDAAPRSVPMMLTGNADFETALRAVNEGQVFRFITKPCETDELAGFVDAAIAQFRLQESAARTTALEHAGRAKSNFLATVSHELRTPLTVVQSTAEILARLADDESPEVRAEFAGAIREHAERMEYMIGQLLEMAQLDADLVCLELAEIDLCSVVVDAVRNLADAACPISFDVDLEHETAPIRGDSKRLGRVVVHLLRNACTYSEPGTPVRIVLDRSDGGYRITVRDRGPGIPPSLASLVFEPFVQREQVLADKPNGLGLGLAIASKVVTLHLGSLCYRDNPGGGSLFTVTLPQEMTL